MDATARRATSAIAGEAERRLLTSGLINTMLEKLEFQSLVEQTVSSKRIPRAMDLNRFVLGIVLGLYIGFPRLNQLRFIAHDPILTGILKVTKLPVQSTFWRFVNALHRNVARQLLTIMRTMRERVWEAPPCQH